MSKLPQFLGLKILNFMTVVHVASPFVSCWTLVCLCFGEITNNAAINIHVQVFEYIFISLEMELLYYITPLCLVFLELSV